MEFSSEAGRSTFFPQTPGETPHTCAQTLAFLHISKPRGRGDKAAQDPTYTHSFWLLSASFAARSVTAASCLPLMVHSEHEHTESASLDTAAEYSAPSCSLLLSPSPSSPTLDSPDPPPPSTRLSRSRLTLPPAQFFPSSLFSSLCAVPPPPPPLPLLSPRSTFIKGLSSDSPSYNT